MPTGHRDAFSLAPCRRGGPVLYREFRLLGVEVVLQCSSARPLEFLQPRITLAVNGPNTRQMRRICVTAVPQLRHLLRSRAQSAS